MATATVDVVVQNGPRFYDDQRQKDPMFVHVVDGATTIGPRVATDEDKAAHPAAWAAYEAKAAEPEAESDEEPERKAITGEIEIPEDWREGDAASRKELASQLAGREVTTAAEADMIVRAEVDKRDQATWP